MKTKLAMFSVLLLSITFLAGLSLGDVQYPRSHKIPNFWDESKGYCFAHQETNLSCTEAAVQMVFKAYNFTPLPTQEELAIEMETDLNHTTNWSFTYIPFYLRNFTNYINESLSQDPDQALANLKGNVSMDFSVIVDTWYDETYKENGTITHTRVITGYNETGVFYHDPSDGPNLYIGNIKFANLWSTDNGFWALIVENATSSPIKPGLSPSPSESPTPTPSQSPPEETPPAKTTGKDLGKYFIDNLDVIALLIVGIASEKHFVGRLTVFSNSIALDLFFFKNNFTPWYVLFYLGIGTFLGIIGLLAYLADEKLSDEYYIFTFFFYSSITVSVIILIGAFLL
jgi:hypothetical protein